MFLLKFEPVHGKSNHSITKSVNQSTLLNEPKGRNDDFVIIVDLHYIIHTSSHGLSDLSLRFCDSTPASKFTVPCEVMALFSVTKSEA